MFKPVTYVTCDKYEFISSLIFNCYPIPQPNCEFECLTVSLQRMTLLMNTKQKIVEKNLFTLKM